MCNWYIHTLRYLYHIMVILDDDFYTPEKCVMSSFPLPHCAPVPPTKTWKYYNCCCRGGSKGPLGPPNFKYPSGYGTGYQTATLMMLQGTGEGCHTSPPLNQSPEAYYPTMVPWPWMWQPSPSTLMPPRTTLPHPLSMPPPPKFPEERTKAAHESHTERPQLWRGRLLPIFNPSVNVLPWCGWDDQGGSQK